MARHPDALVGDGDLPSPSLFAEQGAKGQQRERQLTLQQLPRTSSSAVYPRKDQAQCQTDQQRCRHRQIEPKIPLFDQDVAWQPPDPGLVQQGPKKAGNDQNETKRDQETTHCATDDIRASQTLKKTWLSF